MPIAKSETIPPEVLDQIAAAKFTGLVGPSQIHGLGIFAEKRYVKHELVLEYCGQLRPRQDSRYAIQLGPKSKRQIDATKRGNAARYLNHSCNPNCAAAVQPDTNRVFVYTTWDINPGVEFTIDYHSEMDSLKRPPHRCNCSHLVCRGTI